MVRCEREHCRNYGIYYADDPTVLAWAAQEGRVVLTQDEETLIGFAYERVSAGLPMPGVIEVRQDVPLGVAIADLLILILASQPGEWEGQVLYIPLR
jgi:hypothetical protein